MENRIVEIPNYIKLNEWLINTIIRIILKKISIRNIDILNQNS